MKIVVAMDSFKESLSAQEACSIVSGVISEQAGDAEVVAIPMADGGEGTAKAMTAACNGRWMEKTVTGPLPGMRVEAGFAWFEGDRTALVEMATASGLELLEAGRRNPMMTTTYGTGELIAAAAKYGAGKVCLAVGGSATVDGGTGAATAMGWRFLDNEGKDLPPGGGQLMRLGRIVTAAVALDVEVEVLCDVDNPLCGERGAARIYAPQKGADAEMVRKLEAGLVNLAGCIERQLGLDVADIPGAGAAGGLAAGAIAFMDARLVSGIDTVIERMGAADALVDADWLITGEGRFDRQSMSGKVVAGLAKRARTSGTKVAVLAGEVVMDKAEYAKAGITCALACRKSNMTLHEAMANAEGLLRETATRFAAENLTDRSK